MICCVCGVEMIVLVVIQNGVSNNLVFSLFMCSSEMTGELHDRSGNAN